MTVSIVLTVNNRSPEVCKQVAESLNLHGNEADELIIVLDRPDLDTLKGACEAYGDTHHAVRFVEISGEPGWVCPAKAWNAGFKAATSDLLYCISSEVVQEAGNVQKAVTLAKDGNTAVFGACHNSTKESLVVGAEPGLLANSKMTRPLGFIVCMPRLAVEKIDGFDEAFMDGFWYDDDDLFLRLWKTGIDFLFDDSIHGVHLDHARPGLATEAGKAGIQRNGEYMLKKHGTVHPWPALLKVVTRRAGQTKWEHG